MKCPYCTGEIERVRTDNNDGVMINYCKKCDQFIKVSACKKIEEFDGMLRGEESVEMEEVTIVNRKEYRINVGDIVINGNRKSLIFRNGREYKSVDLDDFAVYGTFDTLEKLNDCYKDHKVIRKYKVVEY
jgi:hypothetical protein